MQTLKSSFFKIAILALIISGILRCESRDSEKNGSFYTGVYPNLFKDLLGKSDQEISAKIESAYNHFFYGDKDTARLYFTQEPDMAYIVDINNNDVRSEGMSYGMMITVQMDKKEEFDRLWKWAKTYMQHESGPSQYYFAWHCRTDGEIISSNSASDGEEWFVTALYFASARWGDGDGIYNYSSEAENILHAMLNKKESSDDDDVVTNLFNKDKKQVVFVPTGKGDNFTDPSYHLPYFYELWARWDKVNSSFWKAAADTSRKYFRKAAHPVTGLFPDYSLFDGTPFAPWGDHDKFQYDAWRVAMNIAMDYTWFAEDEWQVQQSNRLLNFFHSAGVRDYGHRFTLDGKQLSDDHSTGLVAMNAAACLASTNKNRIDFIEDLWNAKIPSGHYRYYDGMLYMIGLLQVSGNFRIYDYSK